MTDSILSTLNSLKEDHSFVIIDAMDLVMVPMFAVNINTHEYSFIVLGDSVSALHSLVLESGAICHMECVYYLRQDFKEMIPDWRKYDRMFLNL